MQLTRADQEAEEAKKGESLKEIKYKPSNLDKEYKATNLDKDYKVNKNIDKDYLLPNNVPLHDHDGGKSKLLNNQAPPSDEWVKLKPTKDLAKQTNTPPSGHKSNQKNVKMSNPSKYNDYKEEFGDPWIKQDGKQSSTSHSSNKGLKYANV